MDTEEKDGVKGRGRKARKRGRKISVTKVDEERGKGKEEKRDGEMSEEIGSRTKELVKRD